METANNPCWFCETLSFWVPKVLWFSILFISYLVILLFDPFKYSNALRIRDIKFVAFSDSGLPCTCQSPGLNRGPDTSYTFNKCLLYDSLILLL